MMKFKLMEIYKEILNEHNIPYNYNEEYECLETGSIRFLKDATSTEYEIYVSEFNGAIETSIHTISYIGDIKNYVQLMMATNKYNQHLASGASCIIDEENDLVINNTKHIIIVNSGDFDISREKLYHVFKSFVIANDKFSINIKKLLNNEIDYTDF